MLANRSPWVVAVVGAAAIAVVGLVAAGVGSIAISPIDTLKVLADHMLPVDIETSPVADPIIWNIRLPRIAAAIGAGLGLGLSGVALQGLFRNPVADPHLTGISSVASIGVLIGLLLGWSLWGPVGGVIGGAVAGGIGSLFVRVLARGGGADSSRLILVGLGFGMAVTAIVATASIAIRDPRVPDVEFWFVGGLSGATWGTALWATTIAMLALAASLPAARSLDVMSLGDTAAKNVGVDINRVVPFTLLVTGLAVGAAVGASGVVAFVGLVGAYVARWLVGPHHKRLLIGGAVAGAVFLVTSDAIGRLIGGRFDVPVGLVTAAIGGPFLVWLVATKRLTR
ncbi:MAG: FecCD family ABC transporter permease [Acidimicrobiia bacterium]